jgi:hypothetical protein
MIYCHLPLTVFSVVFSIQLIEPQAELRPLTNWHRRSIASDYRLQTSGKRMVDQVKGVVRALSSHVPPGYRAFTSWICLRRLPGVKAG